MGRWITLTISIVMVLAGASHILVPGIERPINSHAAATEARITAPGSPLFTQITQEAFSEGRIDDVADVALSQMDAAAITELVPLQDIKQVVAGRDHTCILTTAGGVQCWGRNNYGQLGDGTTEGKSTPVAVIGLSNGIAAIAAGMFHTCALTIADEVLCWGSNSGGQLGDGTTTRKSTPVAVVDLNTGIEAISAGDFYTCALTALGGVLCWGDNSYGQLGDGTTVSSSIPVAVAGLESGMAAISVGSNHTCALTTEGWIKCWGYNSSGQLGNGTTISASTPVDVVGLSIPANAVSAFGFHTCAVMTTGGVKCWGSNSHGQVGDGTIEFRSMPTDVVGLEGGIVAVSTGGYYTCAATDTGKMKCWGGNDRGQLGDSTTEARTSPMDVVGLDREVTAISTSDLHTCVVTVVGDVRCWGMNDFGQLGNGVPGNKSRPSNVIGLPGEVSAISAGGDRNGGGTREYGGHTCALTSAGNIKCWGSNSHGQVGDGTATDRSTPVDVAGVGIGISSLSGGGQHTCALTIAGGAKCWGQNWTGQLGNGTTTSQSAPVSVLGLEDGVVEVGAGGHHTCARMTGGSVKCWGKNSDGQLGNGTFEDRDIPTEVENLGSSIAAINVGYSHTCALASTGGVKCWGLNLDGQLGVGTTQNTNIPADVIGLHSKITAISAGDYHTCALTDTGGVKCWGRNWSGQLGNGTTISQATPTAVVGLESGVQAISAGGSHTCALTSAGGVKCWGYNSLGQVGNNSTSSIYSLPVSVTGLESGILAISSGSSHTCALTTEGGVKCWGLNFNGALGDGSAWRTTPGDVLTDQCYALTLTHVGSGNDPTASPQRALTCPTGYYTASSDVMLTAAPAAGWRVAGWSGTSNDASTATTNALTMPTADMTVSVYYEEIPSNPGDAYEPDNTCAQANALAPDGSTQMHTFHVAGDHDWVRFNVIANRRYVITARAQGSLADLVLTPYRTCDDPTATPWDGFGRDQVLAWVADSTGTVYLRLQNRDPAIFGSGAEYQVSVREVSTGAVVIVGGRQANPEHLQAQINFMTNRAYTIFQQAGYTHDNVYYLSADPVLQPHVDGPSVSANLGYAITAWAASRTQDGEPLYIYLSDHGQVEGFFVNTNDVATTRQIESWLLAFEQQRPNSPVIVIVEACKSGSLITPAHTLARPGRVIITATGDANDAYARDAGQGGGHFSDPFFSALAQGYSIWDSYQLATQAVSTLNLTVGYNQTPWIDGDGDGIPYPLDADDLGAGRQFGLARAPGPAGLSGQAPYIVQPEQPVLAGAQPVTIEVQVLDESRVTTAVWMEVTKPSTLPPSPPPGYTTPVSHAERIDLTYNPLTDRFQVSFAFDEVGVYQLVFQAEDADNQRAQPVALTVSSGSRVYLPLLLR